MHIYQFQYLLLAKYQLLNSSLVKAAEFRDSVNDYLEKLTETRVRSLAEIIDWNEKHPEDQAGIGLTRSFLLRIVGSEWTSLTSSG